MKLFISILFILVSCVGNSQIFPIQQTIGNKTTIVKTAGTFGTLTGFTFMTIYSDTTEANIPDYVRFTPGIVVMTADYALWVRNSTANAWVSIGGGGSITGADNGLSVDGSNVILGGSLNRNTKVGGAGFSFTMDSLATSRFATVASNATIRMVGRSANDSAYNYVQRQTTLATVHFAGLGVASSAAGGINAEVQARAQVALGTPFIKVQNVQSGARFTNWLLVDTNMVQMYAQRDGNLGGSYIDAHSDSIIIWQANSAAERATYLKIIDDAMELWADSSWQELSNDEGIEFYPWNGLMRIDSLASTNDTTGLWIVAWLQDSDPDEVGKLKRIRIPFINTTPTFQQVLTAGSTMTTTNIVGGGNNEFIWENFLSYQIATNGGGGIQLSSSTGNINILPDSIRFQPYLGKMNIDSLRNGIADTTKFKPMAWSPTTGDWVYMNSWAQVTGGASPTWNSILDPTGSLLLTFADNEITVFDNQSNTETFFTIGNNSLTTGTSFSSTTNSMTSGTLFNIVSTSTALASGNELINLSMSGANGTNGITATGLAISVTNTNATSGTNIGIDVTASGATTANWAVSATGAMRTSVGLFPTTDDGAVLGSTALKWSDVFLASGAVINFNAGNYTLTHTAGNLTANGNMVLSSGNFVASAGSVAANNQLLSNSTGSNANLAVMSSNGGSSSTNAPILLGGAASMGIRTVLNGSAGYAMTANQSYATFISGQHAVTEAGSGTHALIAGVGIRATSITGGVATVTNTATLYVEGASSATVAENNYSIFADAGDVRFDGNFVMGGVNAGTSATNTFALFNGTIPSASVTNGVQMYSEDVAASAELKARDEAGNIATLTPHNFTGIPNGRSEDMAWAFYGERNGTYINVDMLKLARLVEKLTGEKLVYIGTTNDKPNPKNK